MNQKLAEARTSWEAMGAVEPGKYAQLISNVLYDHPNALGEAYCKELADLRHYLEKLAWAEIDQELPPWLARSKT